MGVKENAKFLSSEFSAIEFPAIYTTFQFPEKCTYRVPLYYALFACK
jgi:hypothetical protein